ncbi:MAG: hypothetical protein AWU57_4719, partial [Marinobacter sp. T13-3]
LVYTRLTALLTETPLQIRFTLFILVCYRLLITT